jgi:hypothetical protein
MPDALVSRKGHFESFAEICLHEPELCYRELRAIAERSAAQLVNLPPFSEADLYDDQGLPS